MQAPVCEGRYERKFLVPESARGSVENHIRLNPGAFRGIYHPRTVNNLYLDSPALRMEKYPRKIAWAALKKRRNMRRPF